MSIAVTSLVSHALLMLGCVPKADPIIATVRPTCVFAPDKKRKERQTDLVSIFQSSFADAGDSAGSSLSQPNCPVEVTEPTDG